MGPAEMGIAWFLAGSTAGLLQLAFTQQEERCAKAVAAANGNHNN